MIKLKTQTYCQNCPDFEADVNKVAVCIRDTPHYVTTIFCKHKERCEAIKRYLETDATHCIEEEKGD